MNRNAVIATVLAFATLVVYRQLDQYEFINYDDGVYITENPQVQSGLTLRGIVWAFTTNHASNWHPLTWLSHMLDVHLFGRNAGAHHMVNVMFHIANVLLLFAVLKRMTGAVWRSAFVAALFALHPLHVESVAWVAERKDTLSTLFWILTMWAYARYAESPNARRYLLVLLLFAAGLMAKPMLVTLPFVLLLLDYWPLGRTKWVQAAVGEKQRLTAARLVAEKLPFFALAAVSSVVTYWAQQAGGAVWSASILPIGFRIANTFVSYVRYIHKLIWPVDLAVIYPYPESWSAWSVAASCIVLAVLSAAAVRIARRQPHFFVGWFWYLGTLVPVIGLVQVGLQSMADRYAYIPFIGLYVLITWSAPDLAGVRAPLRHLVAGVAMLALGSCAVLTSLQVRHWENSETLFRHALDVTERNAVAHRQLGDALMKKGRASEAVDQFKETLRLEPKSSDAHNNVGAALATLGKFEQAAPYFSEAVRLKPGSAQTRKNLANALLQLGRSQEAEDQFAEVVRLEPEDAEAHDGLGRALAMQHKLEEARRHFRIAHEIDPNFKLPPSESLNPAGSSAPTAK